MRRLTVLSAVTGILLLGISAPQASASEAGALGAYGCPGNLIDTYAVKTGGGVKYGEIQLYYSTADGGTNCAVTVDTRFSHSVKKDILLSIWKCQSGVSAGYDCNYNGAAGQTDSGSYYSYAGPRSWTGMANRCVQLAGWVEDPSSNYSLAHIETNAVHC